MKLTPGLSWKATQGKVLRGSYVRFTKKTRNKSDKKNRMNLLNEFVRHGVFPHDWSHWPYWCTKTQKESSHIDDSEPIQSVGDEEKPYSLGKIIMPIRATTENGRFSLVVWQFLPYRRPTHPLLPWHLVLGIHSNLQVFPLLAEL